MGFGAGAGGFAQGLTAGLSVGRGIRSDKVNEKRYEDSIARQKRLDKENSAYRAASLALQEKSLNMSEKRFNETVRKADRAYALELKKFNNTQSLNPLKKQELQTRLAVARQNLDTAKKTAKQNVLAKQAGILVTEFVDPSTGKLREDVDTKRLTKFMKQWGLGDELVNARGINNGAKFHSIEKVDLSGVPRYLTRLTMPNGETAAVSANGSSDPNDPYNAFSTEDMAQIAMDHFISKGINVGSLIKTQREAYAKTHKTKLASVEGVGPDGITTTKTQVAVPTNLPAGTRVTQEGIIPPGHVQHRGNAPDSAIKHLRAHPNLASQFKAKYGYLPEGFNQ